ncbi:MAG: bifunctional phosphoribosyl-AMP cyclohydrolase/phosphoribosyl-ATP diphosphatase HisIE [Gemmatimonadetes bacterium]|nr:bifunctional phosphoribosyl-AMP cyclohydrolase/phosphoribosyl-ATP diphosphatase HisIE [Gemmatimonadota bacterium]
MTEQKRDAVGDAIRPIRGTADLAGLHFGAPDELIPVIAQDAGTGDVLMIAYANREALERTLETGEMYYYSRSRGELWHKGASSGNVQRVRELLADCDNDAILALVDPAGPACHTGAPTCFGVVRGPAQAAGGTRDAGAQPGGRVLAELWRIINERAATRPAGSYTTRLLDDANLRIKKLGEEVAELIMALSANDRERVCQEAADLVYHLLVALQAAGTTLEEVEAALAQRRRPPPDYLN